ncbi:MAG: UDP-glucose--hexose-1-phosphate uridylyltransferase [Clostridia bacterium]|nr:UDP-glucose--hexose-1-phosphate uridylyltransferase [Clostridia bacterium]
MKTLNLSIYELVNYAISKGLIERCDKCYAVSSVMELFSISSIDEKCDTGAVCRPISEILDSLCDCAGKLGIIDGESITERDLFDTKIMGRLTPRPSEVIRVFKELYTASPERATDYFYSLAIDSNYIREDRIKRDLRWRVSSEYGDIDISINLSKPEKDPKAIAAARLLPQNDYPKCALCHENEGYAGTVSKPARQNLRQIPFTMNGEEWYLQYSPYVYYNEHCIALSAKHSPMKIDRSTFVKLLGFVTEFPHYFIGSNADLKIVGGSILSHDHMQGGKCVFPMERAPIDTELEFPRYPTVAAGIVKWPMSVIRLRSRDTGALVSLADEILAAWRGYTDADAFVFAETDGEPHNTITPIARRRGEEYELDLVLRNNITTDEHPLGVYHPHAERHNIKKENIGLIEVMGLAVLPARLKNEMALMKRAILSGEDIDSVPDIAKHKAWLDTFLGKYSFTEENTEQIIRQEIGKTFVEVLSDAGVYKDTPEGRAAFLKFIKTVR